MAYTTPIVTFGSITFTGEDIKAATLVEECNPLTITLPINTLDVVIHSDDAAFSIINPTGEYALLQTKQPVTVYETTDLGNVLIGQYFLDKWENLSDTQIKLHCVDILGMLDVYTCLGGMWLTPIYATDLLKSILDPLGIAYQIDPYFDTFEITGWLPICTVRQALQQIAFAASAYVLTARQNGVIKFGRQLATGAVEQGINCGVSHTGQSRVYQGRWRPAVWGGVAPIIYITTAEKGSTQLLTLRPLVTGVEITEHNYVSSADTQKLYDGTLSAGLHTIYFPAPMHDLILTASDAAFEPAYGPELTSNGAFPTSSTNPWIPSNSTLSVVSGAMRITNTATTNGATYQLPGDGTFCPPLTVGKQYRATFTFVGGGYGMLIVYTSGWVGLGNTGWVNSGTHSFDFTATTPEIIFYILNSSTTIGAYIDVDDISLIEILGNDAGANYAIINVTTDCNVLLTGEVYVDTTKLAAQYMPGLPAGSVLNTLTITNATLVNDTNGATILSEVYDYYQRRYEQTVRLYAPTAAVGSEVEIDTLYGRSIDGIVEKMSSDLAMGFTVDADIVGTVVAL